MQTELIRWIEEHIDGLKEQLDDPDMSDEAQYIEGCIDASEVILNYVISLKEDNGLQTV